MSLSGFTAPLWFLLLLAAAALLVGYLLVQRTRRKRTLRFTNLELLDRVAPRSQGWPRHLPAALIIGALVLLTIGLAGPTAQAKMPRNRATVMLVIDVSLSMDATDVKPSRIKAAQAAATAFARGLTPGINLGLVSFAGTATVMQQPTTERQPVITAIGNLKLAQSTATGEGIFAAVNAIQGFSAVVGGANGPPPARIVLMSDGKQTVPEDLYAPRGAFTAAEQAKKEGVPVSTISFGTDHGTVFIEGKEVPVDVDDGSLQEVARLSGGAFYQAGSAEQLNRVYADLGEQIGYEVKQTDASRPWVTLGTLSLIAAAGSALFLGQRLP